MEVLLYEYVTGGGGWSARLDAEALRRLLPEGRAMVMALAEDLLKAGHGVHLFWDSRLQNPGVPGAHLRSIASAEEERKGLLEVAGHCDAAILIAPETSGALLDRVRLLDRADVCLLSPGPESVALFSDKNATCRYLRARGVPVPRGQLLAGGRLPKHLRYPVVVKPNDGAGCDRAWVARGPQEIPDGLWRVERWCRGTAASIAMLVGPTGARILPGCYQRVKDAPVLRYEGGTFPLVAGHQQRASRLAEKVAANLPADARGYLGIDLILGKADDGSEDRVVEVNPRLTTSYLALRRAARDNLAQAWLDHCRGLVPELHFYTTTLVFDSDGVVTPSQPSGWNVS